jgi:hypothetical protein
MSDFNAELTAGFYDPKKRANIKNFLSDDKSADVGEYEKMFPALLEDEPPHIPNAADNLPEYSYKSEESTPEQPKKLSQNQRYKLNIQKQSKIIEEQQQELLNLKRREDEMILQNAQQAQQADAARLKILELEARQLDQSANDELFRKNFYNTNEQYDEATKAEKKAYELLALKKEKENQLRQKQTQFQQNNDLISKAYNEYQSKDYVYKPPLIQEVEDESKSEALKRFMKAHPFLDGNNADNPNFSRNLFDRANKIALELEDRYKIEGRGEDIKTDSYYKDLSTNLKNQLRMDYNMTPNNNSYNPGFYPQDDGLSSSSYSQDYSAPVTPTRRSSAYTAPMSQTDRQMRANTIQQAKALGIPESELIETYDSTFNTVRQSL